MKVKDTPIDLKKALLQKGPKFRSHTIIFNENVADLKPTISSLLFCVIYIVVGLFLLLLAVIVYVKNHQLDFTIFLGAFGIAILTFGITLVMPFVKQVTFDKNRGSFRNNIDRKVELGNIVSLQILDKVITSKNGLNYPCYELNMLTKNGRRINILNHNDLVQLKSDSEKLADFLSVELIDLQCEMVL
ncbi:hypothetical protein [Granulosicoccus antarcticus]|uniref:Uncharacterized protein n=1 Tax=Granulosicoccus antarcticus IMCC3135 TaxID=1192854 RepID=A0A2Z2NVL6_9GAMM|nr:hypothetical protein [Granulosicoccus antarcticus]ASJ75379.1 hypothetical protein IMCC3135_26620 [Granulosicoccus antarcticus IMCC3135]